MSSSLRIWPFGQIQRESSTFGPSPLVANTGKNAQNGGTTQNACLFSRHSAPSRRSSRSSPLASLAHSCPSVPDGQPTGAIMRDSGRPGQNLADRSPFTPVIVALGSSSSADSGESAPYLLLCSLDPGSISTLQSGSSGTPPVGFWETDSLVLLYSKDRCLLRASERHRSSQRRRRTVQTGRITQSRAYSALLCSILPVLPVLHLLLPSLTVSGRVRPATPGGINEGFRQVCRNLAGIPPFVKQSVISGSPPVAFLGKCHESYCCTRRASTPFGLLQSDASARPPGRIWGFGQVCTESGARMRPFGQSSNRRRRRRLQSATWGCPTVGVRTGSKRGVGPVWQSVGPHAHLRQSSLAWPVGSHAAAFVALRLLQFCSFCAKKSKTSAPWSLYGVASAAR